jgi:RHH-type proline utilization regulon transcriptional repressor/proline dehydrogenase/delta 1-pyrroline-5-carboxylate dehydrogenase
VKRVVSEMGGKNCVIVDADADLDEVVPEVVVLAFGYAGQKCSAAARVLVHEATADTLLERLAGAIRGARRGPGRALRHRGAAGDRARGAGARRALRRDGPSARRGARPAARRGLVLPAALLADLPDDSPC